MNLELQLNGNAVDCAMTPETQAKLLGFILMDMERRYSSIDGAMRAVMKVASRKILMDMERKARKQSGEEAAMRIRPPKAPDGKTIDANLHLGRLMFGLGNEALKNVTVAITLEESGDGSGGFTVADVAIKSVENQGQIGRPMVDSGHDGEWQDDLQQIAGGAALALVPAS